MNNSESSTYIMASTVLVYEYVYGDTFSHIFYIVALILILTVGPLACIALVIYERFGADSQKRTIINRLSFHMFLRIALQTIIWSVLRISRDVYGPLPSHLITPA